MFPALIRLYETPYPTFVIRLPISVHTHTPFDRKRKRFLSFARNDDTGKRYSRSTSFPCRKALVQGHGSPSFLWKEVPRRGGGWLTKRNKKEWGRSIFPYRHPERSRGIFIALPPYAHMHPHSNDTLVLPFSPFPRSRFTALQEGSLHFGPHDTQERRIVSYCFSYRYHCYDW